MDSAKYLARIDSLCAGDLTVQHSGSDVLMEGPGYRIVSLEATHGTWTGDAARRARTVADFHALKEHISLLLDDRWGARQPPWWMGTLVVRIDRGEAIPEPWSTASTLVDELNVWQPDGTGRWVAVGVADADLGDETHLLVLITETDPP
ncbi:hypothetical protein AB0H86_10520 [Streptomyces sp. NPDC050997]|uniref:hypothetical protein n=1 Tax=Streptomyces sp. NPDC050997 TaxID=3155519 RepID=UPI00342F0285